MVKLKHCILPIIYIILTLLGGGDSEDECVASVEVNDVNIFEGTMGNRRCVAKPERQEIDGYEFVYEMSSDGVTYFLYCTLEGKEKEDPTNDLIGEDFVDSIKDAAETEDKDPEEDNAENIVKEAEGQTTKDEL